MTTIPLVIAFTAGFVSFLAPCVLPLIPGFLAYLAGTSIQEAKTKRWMVFMNSVWFVLGFAAVFSLLGVLLNTILTNVAYDVQIWLARIGGALVILFGIYLLGLIKIPWLETQHKLSIHPTRSRYLTSFLFGASFAAGWTPCVGPVLGAIFGLAAAEPGSAFVLLLAYTIGLGIPFLIVGFFTAQAAEFIHRHGRAFKVINVLFGIVLIAFGILIFTQQLSRIANFELLNRFLLK